MGPTWDPPGADRTQVGPMLAPWSFLSGMCLVLLSGTDADGRPKQNDILQTIYFQCIFLHDNGWISLQINKWVLLSVYVLFTWSLQHTANHIKYLVNCVKCVWLTALLILNLWMSATVLERVHTTFYGKRQLWVLVAKTRRSKIPIKINYWGRYCIYTSVDWALWPLLLTWINFTPSVDK